MSIEHSAGKPNEDFYKFIVDLTSYSEKKILTPTAPGHKDQLANSAHSDAATRKHLAAILRSDADQIFALITQNFKLNIQAAAASGYRAAYLCIYEKSAKYRGLIPVHDFVEMPEKMRDALAEFAIEPVMARVRGLLAPFVVQTEIILAGELNCAIITAHW
jgi:hypothetical protein